MTFDLKELSMTLFPVYYTVYSKYVLSDCRIEIITFEREVKHNQCSCASVRTQIHLNRLRMLMIT
jgi:hypothetical protein